MSEQIEETSASEETTAVESTEQSQQETQSAPTQEKATPAGQVDLSGLPPELAEPIQKRLDWLYYQAKEGKRVSKEVQELRDIARQQSEVIEQLNGGMGAVVGHLQQERFATTEQQLMTQRQAAWESGDTKAINEIDGKLMDLKVEKRLAAQQKPQPKKTETQKEAYAGEKLSGQQLANDAFSDGEITPEEHMYSQAWLEERDESGNLLRPWATGKDAKSQYALLEAAAVLNPDGPYSSWPMQKKLEEIDRRMGLQKNTGSQAVLGANLTSRNKSAKITLSPKAQELAIRTKFAGPGKTNDEHIAAWRKQLETVKKGAR